MMLALEGIECYYGNVRILKGVSLGVDAGQVVALLGRNGAGKTTTLKAIMRLVDCRAGTIRVDGEDLTRRAPHAVSPLGVAYVPQGRRLFTEMTVAENLRMGMLARPRGVRGAAALESVLELFPVLRERLAQRAGTLSGGQQQMLAMGRALCAEPKVLLLDEPSEGLQPSFVQKVLDTIEHLKESGVAVLLVEQKVDAAMQVADRIVFLENGAVSHEAAPREFTDHPELLERYVGVRRA